MFGITKEVRLLVTVLFLTGLFVLVAKYAALNQHVFRNGGQEEQQNIQRIMKFLRNKDIEPVKALLNVDVESLSDEAAKEEIYRTVAQPVQGVCRSMKRLGGMWMSKGNSWHAFDGDKFYCMDHFRNSSDCLIYSFGIRDDWTFEDLVDGLGCTVYAYDPTTTAPSNRGNSIHFFKKGISEKQREIYDTLDNFMVANNHTGSKIHYLKVDVEGEEFNTLQQWIEGGALNQVEQLGIEIHLSAEYNFNKGFKWMLKMLQDLYKMNFRLVSYEANLIPGKDASGYYSFFEVVLMKDNIWNYLDTGTT